MGKIIDIFYLDFDLEQITVISLEFWLGIYSLIFLKSYRLFRTYIFKFLLFVEQFVALFIITTTIF